MCGLPAFEEHWAANRAFANNTGGMNYGGYTKNDFFVGLLGKIAHPTCTLQFGLPGI
jgi:hypothetical protein